VPATLADGGTTPRPFLERLGLHRPQLRAWAMYDWANSVFMTTIIQVFQVYFARVVAADLPPAVASARFYTATALGALVILILAPVLGALADYAGVKKKMLGVFLALGVVCTLGLCFVGQGDITLGATLYVLASIGAAGTLVFYDSLLPHIASHDEVDRVSTAGFALGYLGGGLLLALNLVAIRNPAAFGIPDTPTAFRLAFLSAAVWWAAFSIPLFLRVPEPARRIEADESLGANPVRVAFSRLAVTFRELRGYRQAFLMLVAFLIYNDGINTIIKVGATFGTEIGIPAPSLLLAILMIQFVGVPCAFMFGYLADRMGAKRAIFIGLAVYFGISVLGYRMTSVGHFFVLAFLIGTVQGGSQALSRSLFATLIPRHKSAEFFGFFAVSEKFAGILGPTLFAVMVTTTGSSRNAILALILFFAVGGGLLSLVDVKKGREAAEEANSRAREAEGAA
jgi:UMF1 family MFS transporter